MKKWMVKGFWRLWGKSVIFGVLKALEILMVCNRLPWPLNDGGNIATYHVMRELVERGHRVVLVSLNTLKHRVDVGELERLVEVHAYEIDTTVRMLGLLGGLVSRRPYNVWRFWDEGFAGLLRKVLRGRRFDVVQLEGSYLSLYSEVIRAEGRGAKLVLRSHNVEYKIWDRLAGMEGNALKRMYLRNLTPKLRRFEGEHLGDYDGVVAITEEDAVEYKRMGYKGALRVVNGGVDLGRFRPVEGKVAGREVAFLGSLEWLPNVQGLEWFLREVWPLIYKGVAGARLHVAGKNPPAVLAGLEQGGVVMHGMVEDAAEYLRDKDIFVVPLHSGGGMRMKIVEAMGAGLCVVSTRIGAEGIAYTEGVDLVVCDGVEEWVRVLTGLLADAECVGEIGRAGRALAKARYGWAAVGKGFEEFYGEVLG